MRCLFEESSIDFWGKEFIVLGLVSIKVMRWGCFKYSLGKLGILG